MIAWAGVERANMGLFDDLSGGVITRWTLKSLFDMYNTKSITNNNSL